MILTFKELTRDNFKDYQDYILLYEQIYPEKIRSSQEDYIEMLLDDESIALVLEVDSRYAGSILGCPLEEEDRKLFNINIPLENTKVIYLYNIIIAPEYQGKGLGYGLLKEFIRVVKEKGYYVLVGHFRPNGSATLIKKFGGEVKQVWSNWEDSGEDYLYCELDLKSVAVT